MAKPARKISKTLSPCVRCMLSLPLGGDRIGSHVHGAGSQAGSAYPPGLVVPALAFKLGQI